MPNLDAYIEPILIALIVFPLLAFIFTFPFVYFEYRKYKSIPWVKALVIYSFVYYLLAVYLLVILPLPDRSTVQSGGYLESMTLIPFIDFIEYYQKHGLTLRFFVSFDFFQVVYNCVMLVPFGVYMRYYFQKSWSKSLLYAFLISLFLEVTQLSGLYGIYPGPYRCFDVNDLICNSLGALLGWVIGLKVLFFMPSREKLDEQSLKGKVRGLQVIWALMIDFVVFAIPYIVFMVLLSIVIPKVVERYSFGSMFGLLYFTHLAVCAIRKNGGSPGKSFCNMRIICIDPSLNKNAHFVLRYGIIAMELSGCKIISDVIGIYFSEIGALKPICFLADIIPLVFIVRYIWHIFVNKRDMLYERLSKTRIVSNLE